MLAKLVGRAHRYELAPSRSDHYSLIRRTSEPLDQLEPPNARPRTNQSCEQKFCCTSIFLEKGSLLRFIGKPSFYLFIRSWRARVEDVWVQDTSRTKQIWASCKICKFGIGGGGGCWVGRCSFACSSRLLTMERLTIELGLGGSTKLKILDLVVSKYKVDRRGLGSWEMERFGIWVKGVDFGGGSGTSLIELWTNVELILTNFYTLSLYLHRIEDRYSDSGFLDFDVGKSRAGVQSVLCITWETWNILHQIQSEYKTKTPHVPQPQIVGEFRGTTWFIQFIPISVSQYRKAVEFALGMLPLQHVLFSHFASKPHLLTSLACCNLRGSWLRIGPRKMCMDVIYLRIFHFCICACCTTEVEAIS